MEQSQSENNQNPDSIKPQPIQAGLDETKLKKIKNAKSLAMTLGILFIFYAVLLGVVMSGISQQKTFIFSSYGMNVLLVGLLLCLVFAVYYITESVLLARASASQNTEKMKKIILALFISSIFLALLSIKSGLGLLIYGGSAYYFYMAKEALR
jgi:nitric oxide reductase large subunit